jgi:hypothetical protein
MRAGFGARFIASSMQAWRSSRAAGLSPAAERNLPMTALRRGLIAASLGIALAAPAVAQSSDPSFRLNNRTRTVINEIYVSSSNDSGWGADRLGANVLSPGQSLVIRLPNGQCVNDIRVVYANGQPQEWRRQNTCAITDFNIN